MVIIEDTHWIERLPHAEALVEEALRTAMQAVPPGPDQADGPLDAVTVMLADDAALARMNRDFRGKSAPTNVLAFAERDADLPGDGDYLGDLAIAIGTVEREAEEQGKSLQDHLVHLVVHGYLHLVGHDHIRQDEREAMEACEIEILAALGIANPYEARSAEALS